MRSQIYNNSGIFEITGKLVAENAVMIQDYFERRLKNDDRLVVNLDKVESIDEDGVQALSSLYEQAIKNNKILYIIGKQNKNLHELFNRTKRSFILSSDFL